MSLPQVSEVQPLVSNVQSALHSSTPPVKPCDPQSAPARSLPAHSSTPSATPSPQVGPTIVVPLLPLEDASVVVVPVEESVDDSPVVSVDASVVASVADVVSVASVVMVL